MEQHAWLHRFHAASSGISQRAFREAARAHSESANSVGTEPRVVEMTPADLILAIVLEPEVLAHLVGDCDIPVDVRAARRARAPEEYSDSGDPIVGPMNTQRRGTIGESSAAVVEAFEFVNRWAASELPDSEVKKWTPHSDRELFMSSMPPNADDDPWPPERVHSRVYRFAVMREVFERLLEVDAESVTGTLVVLGITEMQIQRCFDSLATRYMVDFTGLAPDP